MQRISPTRVAAKQCSFPEILSVYGCLCGTLCGNKCMCVILLYGMCCLVGTGSLLAINKRPVSRSSEHLVPPIFAPVFVLYVFGLEGCLLQCLAALTRVK